MRRKLFVSAVTAGCIALVLGIAAAATGRLSGGSNPDLPPRFAQDPDANKSYLRLRDEYVGRLRGLEPGMFADPAWRTQAVATRFRQERAIKSPTTWTEIGPATISNGQSLQYPADTAVSGRVTAIAVDPTNSSKAYLGTAQGGVWRTLNGGTTWTPLFDTAASLSIGALALAPSNPSILYVGTGEPNLSADSFFGVGLYRIDNADTSAMLVGPINPSVSGENPFTSRAISQILVHPTDPATIFVSTTTGIGGIGGNSGPSPRPTRGVFRSINATAAAGSVAFTRLTVQPTADLSVTDMTFVNNDPTILLVSVFNSPAVSDGGVWRTATGTSALDPVPTFTRTLILATDHSAFAVSGNTVLFATDESSGRLRESTDGGATWSTPLTAANGFCDGQCFYDLPVAIDPRTSGSTLRIYLGGGAGGSTVGASGLKVSNNNGTSFSVDQEGLHADFHSIVVDSLSNPSTVWVGNDGGVWKRAADAPVATAWTNLNNSLGTLQFQGLAVGKSDDFFSLGGTQDNGTNLMQTSLGTWTNAEGGDGGYTLIDQSATSTSLVTMYHTFFNQTNNFIGFDRTNVWPCAKDTWEYRGSSNFANDLSPACDGTAVMQTNGIVNTDSVEFYAPMALGPPATSPNTLYFGTNRLYRSIDRGDTMVVASQAPITAGTTITTIGISPQDDNYRIVGLRNGQVWATATGSSTLTQMTGLTAPTNANGSSTNKWVGRAVIDPNDKNTAYVTFAYYTTPSTDPHVWKTTNLNAATPTWTGAANGIPNIPVNAFAIDPNDSTHLFAGTDIGVYASTDAGATWAPLGTGLPAVAVFGMAIVQPGTATEKLRVATHGRSMWQIDLTTTPTAVAVSRFAAARTAKGVAVSWRTRSEAQIVGFNVFRNGAKVNRTLIAAKHSGTASGAVYRFVDRAARAGHRYTYRLQVVDLAAKRSWYVAQSSVSR